jgi:phosphoenolpyruvate carboxykinase (ATP)
MEKLIEKKMLVDQSDAQLIELALKQDKNNSLSSNGSLVIFTGEFTGRAAEDKYVVTDNYSTKVIDWSNHIRSMTSDTFQSIKNEIIERFNKLDGPIFVTNRSVSADLKYSLGVKLITNSAAHSLFSKNIFRENQAVCPMGIFSIYHDPTFKISVEKYKVHSPTVIAINFESKEIIIVGTGYAGEIKKSIFSVMNTLLPDHGILPMHTGSNMDKNGHTSLFFGLSGTGKTTLSTDINVDIIGDDEHGLSPDGIFNFEGGCYAKTDGLKNETEPEIFRVANQFRSLLENVVLDPVTRDPQFMDRSITENGRATYSLRALENIVQDGRGPVPTNLFFLSADALGVLPPVSKLNNEQAIFYFLSGYTAKLAGTELGSTGIKETFSHCFGAPFMMRKPHVYGDILSEMLKKFPINVWLINTGWYGGDAKAGKRYPLKFTRECIRTIQSGDLKNIEFHEDEVFHLNIPTKLGEVDQALLNPISHWQDINKYYETARNLKNKFDENYKKLKS